MSSTQFAIDCVSGVVSGMCSVVVGQPLDTIRTRVQVQGGNRTAGAIAGRVFAEEGVRGLYRGVVPPLFAVGLGETTWVGVVASGAWRGGAGAAFKFGSMPTYGSILWRLGGLDPLRPRTCCTACVGLCHFLYPSVLLTGSDLVSVGRQCGISCMFSSRARVHAIAVRPRAAPDPRAPLCACVQRPWWRSLRTRVPRVSCMAWGRPIRPMPHGVPSCGRPAPSPVPSSPWVSDLHRNTHATAE